MSRTKISRQPSPYPSIAFHSVRLGQVLSSLIVTAFLGYFIHHLSVELFDIPWTFILLITVSALTLGSFVITSVLHAQRSLKPKWNAIVNGSLLVIWMLGFALLVWNLSGTLQHKCNISNWQNELGVMVCRIFKALTAFTVTGLVSTAAALFIDIRTVRNGANRGIYNPMQDRKTPGETFGDGHREPSLEFPAYSHKMKKPYSVQRTIEANQFGYSAPSEQTAYDSGAGGIQLNSGYGNGHGV